MQIFPKLIYTFDGIPEKIPSGLLCGNLKMYTKNYKIQRNKTQTQFWKRIKVKDIYHLISRLTGKAIKNQYSDIDIMYNKQTS